MSKRTLWVCGFCGSARVYYHKDASWNVEGDLRDSHDDASWCDTCEMPTAVVEVKFEVAA